MQSLTSKQRLNQPATHTLDEFLSTQDFAGALVLVDILRAHPESCANIPDIDVKDLEAWRAYLLFHQQRYTEAETALQAQLHVVPDAAPLYTQIALCQYFRGDLKASLASLSRGDSSPTANRLGLLLSHRLDDEDRLLAHHSRLVACTEDQVSLAAVHYLRAHFEEAIRAYEDLLSEDSQLSPLHLYIAMCYYRLDCYAEAVEALDKYLGQNRHSLSTVILSAACTAKLQGREAAKTIIEQFLAQHPSMARNPLIKHNLCVLNGLRRADLVLPSLLSAVPLARQNLVTYYLRSNRYAEAWSIVKDWEPADPQEFIARAAAAAALAASGDRAAEELASVALAAWRLVGESPQDQDLLHGRQCMALAQFASGDFTNTLRYLSTIEDICPGPELAYLKGVALAATAHYDEACDALETAIRGGIGCGCLPAAQLWLARSLTRSGRADEAWLMLAGAALGAEARGEALQLCDVVADDAFAAKEYLTSARAFDVVISRATFDATKNRGRRGLLASLAGALKNIHEGKMSTDELGEIYALANAHSSTDESLRRIAATVHEWRGQL